MKVWCRKCGIVRDVAPGPMPWCRHFAIDVPAQRMEPLPSYHPLAASGATRPGGSSAS